jgi:hypothetical protein
MTRRRWKSDRWARAAGCVCPRAAGHDGWEFLAREPWQQPRQYERGAGYPSRSAGYRAGGAAENFETVRRIVCAAPGWRELSTVGRTVLALDETAKLIAWVVQAYGVARSGSFGLLPAVSTSSVTAVFDAMDGMFALCAPRAGGLRGDSLRALATAIDIVGNAAVAVPLYGLATVIGASGLLAKVVGVIATGQIGGAIAAVVGVCQGLRASGIVAQLRQVARELDAEDTGVAPAIPSPIFGLLPGDLPTWTQPAKYPPAPTTTDGGGGGVFLGLSGLGLGLLLLKAAL